MPWRCCAAPLRIFPGRREYRVLDDPLPGAAVRGRTLILSRGLHHYTYIACVVPKLKHRSLKAAKELLRRKECLPGAVTRAYGAKKSARVVRQGHKPKTILPPGSKVSIRLAG